MSWESFQQQLNGNKGSAGWQQFQNRLAGMQGGQANASDGWNAFQQRLTGQRAGSNAEAYRASGMDALRKDAGALRDSMTRYFENEHKASGTDAGNSYRAKANNMLSAIQKERDYFKRYASAFTQEDLQKYNAELDDYERQLRSLTGYFGNGQGVASDSTGAVWGSGYSALSKGLSALNESAQPILNGTLTTQAQKDALLAQQKALTADLDATEQYIKRNAVLFSKEEKERWDEELSNYRKYLNSLGTYLAGQQSGLKNPFTGFSVYAPSLLPTQQQQGGAADMVDAYREQVLDEYLPKHKKQASSGLLPETASATKSDKTDGRRYGRNYSAIWNDLTEAYDTLVNLQNQSAQYKDPDRSSLPENYANMHLVEYAEEKNAENRQKLQQAQEKFDRLAKEAAIVGSYVYENAMDESKGASDRLTSGDGAADWFFDTEGRARLISGLGSDRAYWMSPEGNQKLVYAFINSPEMQDYVLRLNSEGDENGLTWAVDSDRWAKLAQLTDEERRAYNYLYNQYGVTDAAQFLDILLNGTLGGDVKSLGQRAAEARAEEWNAPFARALYAGSVGLDTVWRDLNATLRGEARSPSISEQTVAQMREDSGTWGKAVIDASGSLGRMLPAMAASGITGVPAFGSLVTGITSGASGYQEGMRPIMEGGKGFSSPWQGLAYGIGSGVSEAALQDIAGGIPGLKGVLPEAVGEKLAGAVSSGLGRAAIKYGASVVSEVLEEEAQNYLEPLLVSVVTGRKYDAPSVEELVDTALSTLLLTGATNAVALPASVANETAAINEQLAQQEKAFSEAAMAFPEDSEIYLAGKEISEALENGALLDGKSFRDLLSKIGADESAVKRLRSGNFTQEDAQTIRLEQNAAEYAKAGMSAEQAKAAADVLNRVTSGENVNNSDIRKLRLNTDAGAQVLSKVFGTDVKKAANNREAANAIFRAAELKYKTRTAQELYGNAELDVRKLPATQESADAILGNEQAKADFQKIFGVNLDGNYSDQVNKIVKKLEYWWMANYKTQEQETASQQVARWNAEHPQTVQDAANMQQNAENAANAQQNEQNSQLNIDNAAISEYTETKTQGSGGVSDVGNRVDSGVAEGVPVRRISSEETPRGTRGFGRRHQVFPRRAVSQDLQNAMNQSGVVAAELYDFDADTAAFSSALDEARNADAKNGWCVTPQNAEDLQGKATFMDADGTIGFAVTSDGDIEAVFKNREKNKTPRAMNGVMPQAIATGGVKLDCYGDVLVGIYENYGFIPVARVEFNEAYANDGWNESKGKPYIYFMIHNGDSAKTVAANIGKYEHMSLEQLNALPTYGKEGYDEAAAYRDGLLENSVGAARSGFDPYSHAANEYGTIAPGENPARVVDVPKSMDGTSRVSKVARTAMEAEATSEGTVGKLEHAVTDGLFSYDAVTNEQRRAKSEEWFSNFSSTETALDAWRDSIKGRNGRVRMGIDEYSNGIYLYAELNANAKGADNDTMREHYEQQAVGVLSTLQDTATEVGQMVQLNRMFKQLTPESRVMTLNKSIEALNAELSKTAGIKVKLNEELQTTYVQALNSGNEALIEQAEKNIYHDIASQAPADFLAKFNAWRYLCMLGNPKTIIRNTLGNVFMMPLKAAKDKLGAVMELGLDKQDRTKYLGSIYLSEEGRKMFSYAKDSFSDVKDVALGAGKYESQSAGAKVKEAIREKQNRLPSVLGKAQDLVDTAMNNEVFGDGAFLKHHYAASFAQAALARGYTAADFRNGTVSQAQMENIRTYAIEQAQKATYRDVNAFSNIVRKMRFRGDNVGAKVGNWLVEGVIPFKATPANVLVRAAEYGPLGIMRAIGETLTNFSRRAKGGETISGGQIIEHLASGLTGTAVFSLGILLKNLGIVELTGAGDDDDDREGKQSWSVQIGDTSISLDWLAPAAIPFFMGVNVAEAWEDPNNSAIDVISDTLGAMYEPMLEMSMLSGIQDVLDSMAYAESGDVEKLMYAFFAQPFISYLGQGIPTLLSQTARTLDGNNEYTYTGDISGSVNKRFVKSLAKVAKKIPFVNWRQYDYVDEWGRTEDNGNVLERFFNNFVNPAYTSEVVVTDADEEIERLQVMTGEDCAPTRRSYSITVNGEKRKLSGEEYERYSKTYGEEALNMMSALMASSTYAALDDDGKVAALKDVLSVADEFGKHAALGDEYTPKTDGKLYTLSKTGVPIAEAYAAKLYREELNNSDLKASTKTANFENWVSHRDWAQTQKDAVLEAYGTFTTTMRADSGKYDELSASIGEDKALRVVEQLDGLQPESGASTVSDTQRIETIAGMNLSDGEKWDAYAAYKDDWRIPYFEDAELNPNVYAAYLRAIPEYRLTKNGTKSSAWNETTIWNWLRTTEYSNEVRQRIAKIALMSKPKEGSK